MERNRKCILCETIHVSKQEMDEHMRSMLHHRELEKLKGRDCGHECSVCKVTVVSLTDYASHISSPTHKQNVEASEGKHAGKDCDEDYFDQVLIDLIEKRKEQIRKEKQAAAAKLAKEEEDRKRKEDFQRRLKEAKERYQRDGAWQKPSHGYTGSSQQSSWYRNNQYNAREGEARPWNHSKQGKSATWHAQEPPNFQKWASGQFAGGSLHSWQGWGNKQWDQGAFSDNQRRLPWLSNGGSSNGIYGRNNIAQTQQKGRPLSIVGPSMYPPPPSLFAQTYNKFQNTGNGQGGQQVDWLHNGEAQTAESDHNSNKSSKNLGSNPKLDKACRWSPYPATKVSEYVPHKDANPNSSETYPKDQRQDKAPETRAFNRQSRPDQKPGQLTSSVEKNRKHITNPQAKARERSSSGSRSSSAHKDDHRKVASGSSSQKATKSLQQKEQKTSSIFGLSSGTQHSKTSSTVQAHAQSKSTSKQSGLSTKAPPARCIQSKQEQQLLEVSKKARQTVLEKRSSLDSSGKNRNEMAHSVEEQWNHAQSQVGVNKENSCRQNKAKPDLPDSGRLEKPPLQTSDSSQFLQSFQVSTSTMESSEPATSRRENEGNKGKNGQETSSVVPHESMQAVEAGQSSESDTSRTGEAQLDSQSNTTGPSKLDLPPALRRDLTKHISSKSRAGSHEPNLNIARRVRNLSESRRSDPEKDTGLKPTVRQLISSSGSRRNVNWEQVYQEVRKKQDKGKGMPRFGIEMVPLDQEDQSQEDDDIPLLEGFQWDSVMDISASGTSRKRSLSESSLAPASGQSLFPSLTPKEAQKESLNSEQQGSSNLGNQDNPSQQELAQMLDDFAATEQKQPDKLLSSTVAALQRYDSVLGDSSSGTEQYDSQGTGKRRRAAGDVPSAETSCVEHNNKRRKVKSKKDRLQIDQLLAVSLREEELSRSLQTVDTSLIQARAALQAAYMEVQRLMVVKQQMTGEMNTLRNKRIELLKGMQGGRDEAPQVKLKEEKMDSVEAEPHVPSSIRFSSAVEGPQQRPAAPCPSPLAERASRPSSSFPLIPVAIKQEPQSPVHLSLELDPVDDVPHLAHSTTPELQFAPAAAAPPDPVLYSQPSPERNPAEMYQTEDNWENFGDCKESLSGLVETVNKATQVTKNCPSPLADFKPSTKLLSHSRRDSEVGSVADCGATQSFESASGPSLLNMPASPSELKSGKRVRKLKKRKVLKKAQGTEQPESSDTELDGEALRPKWLRSRRRLSGGSQVSTSTQPSADRDADVNMEGVEEAMRQPFPAIKHEKADPKSPKHMVELSQVAPAEIDLKLDSEDGMEVTAACQQPHMDALVPASPPALGPNTSRAGPQSLACNEVTSTSDIDICKSSESDIQGTIILPKITKTSSDVSSDHSEDNLPTKGVFEGHQEAVNAMQIDNDILYTCSGDRTVRAFDLVSHKCVSVFEGHSSKVNCLSVSANPSLHHRLYSGSSDQTIRCYSLKTQKLEQQFSLSDRVLCLHSRWTMLYAGLANGTVVTINLKTNKQMDVFECHGPRAVSCLASSQEGARRILLVGSYDSTISVRDAKNGLLLRTLEGHTKTVLCMNVVNDLVFSGSSDQCVHAHNIHTGELVRVYKGHSHAVTVVVVLGKVMVTACLDKLVRVLDLQSHGQLQVYGGHNDMVMCMALHKNMIYTGCYDGSVQAVKLNLLQNFRCRWHGCQLVFGMMAHLQKHLIGDHAGTSLQTPLRCRWKNCEDFFCARSSSKQGMLVHMQKHAEEETEVEP